MHVLYDIQKVMDSLHDLIIAVDRDYQFIIADKKIFRDGGGGIRTYIFV